MKTQLLRRITGVLAVMTLALVAVASTASAQEGTNPSITIGTIEVSDANICTSDVLVKVPVKITDADNDLTSFEIDFQGPLYQGAVDAILIPGPREKAADGATLGDIDKVIEFTLPKQPEPGKWTAIVRAQDGIDDSGSTASATFTVNGDCAPSEVVPEVTITNATAVDVCTANARVAAAVSIKQADGRLGAYRVDLELVEPADGADHGHVMVAGPNATAPAGSVLSNFEQEVVINLPQPVIPGKWNLVVNASTTSSVEQGREHFDTTKFEYVTVGGCTDATPTPVPSTPTPAPGTPTAVPSTPTATPTTPTAVPTTTTTPTAAPSTTAQPATSTPTPKNKVGLAYTGSDSDQLALIGGAIVLAGLAFAGLSMGAKRR